MKKSRKIQVHIVSIFLILLIAFSTAILFFNHERNYKSVLDLSGSIILQVSDSLVGKIDDLTSEAQLMSVVTKGLIVTGKEIPEYNQLIIPYLINAIKSDQLLSSAYIGTSDGNFVAVSNISNSGQIHFYANPSNELPKTAKYALRVVNRTTQTPREDWEYKDTDFKTIAQESIDKKIYDPRDDSWYVSTASWPSIHWSNIHANAVGNPVITVSAPAMDSSGKVLAVVGVNISLKQLSNYISRQIIGITGKVFVIDRQGQVIIPTEENAAASYEDIPPNVVNAAFVKYSNEHQNQFLLESDRKKYLASVFRFPITMENSWLIVMLVPFTDFFGTILKNERDTILISLVIFAGFAILVYLSSKFISAPIVQLAKDVDDIKRFNFQDKQPVQSHISEIIELDSSIATMRAALRSFGHYVPKEIVNTLIEQRQEIALGGKRSEMTLMFSDIENFTSIAETLPIDQLNATLAEYFDVLSKIVLENEGTIDKYIGDSIMVFWGAPKFIPDHVEKACLSSLKCLNAINERSLWRTRFGLHTGEVIVGNVGTKERMNYTAIGDVVNTTSRFQGLNKTYNTSIIISETIHEQISSRFVTRPLDFVAVKGKTKKLIIYELVGTKEGELSATPDQVHLCAAFTNAYRVFAEGKIQDAEALFLAIKSEFPEDKPTQIYLERIQFSPNS